MSKFFYCGRGDSLLGLIANPGRYGYSNPQEYNDYMNGYNSVSKSEIRSRKDLLKYLDEFKKNEKRKV